MAKEKKLKNVIVMDIGTDSIKCVVGTPLAKDRLRVTHTFKIPVSKNLYENGRILDEDAFGTIVLNGLKENQVKAKDCIVTIESTEFIERELIVPKVDESDLNELITYEMGQYLPIDIESYEIQFKILDTLEDDKLSVIVGAMPKEIAFQFYQLIEKLHLNPIALDVHTNSIEKIIDGIQGLGSSEESIAMIDYGYQVINISIYENSKFKFNRMIQYGAATLFDYFEREYNLSIDEVKSIIESLEVDNLMAEDENIGEVLTDVLKVKAELSRYFTNCTEEISKVLKYYNSRSSQHQVKKILVYGGMTNLFELNKWFESNLNIETTLVKHLKNTDFVQKSSPSDCATYLNAVGALIRK